MANYAYQCKVCGAYHEPNTDCPQGCRHTVKYGYQFKMGGSGSWKDGEIRADAPNTIRDIIKEIFQNNPHGVSIRLVKRETSFQVIENVAL